MMGKDTLRSGAQVALGSTLTIVIGSGNEEEKEESVIVDDSWFE
jgi:hypothetical protein